MKAAVFAALATTAAAFAPVARPLATAAATKLSVVPETVAELPSMLTALPTLTAPQEGELFFTSPFSSPSSSCLPLLAGRCSRRCA